MTNPTPWYHEPGPLMNVVIVNDFAYVYGGAAKVAVTTARALAAAGHKVKFFAKVGPIGEELKGLPSLEVTCLDGTTYTKLPARRAMTEGLYDRSARYHFEELLKGLRPSDTVVHIHSNRDALSSSVVQAAIEKGFPTIYSSHDYTLGCPYGAFFNQRTLQICPLRGLSGRCITTYCNRGSRLKKLWMTRRQLTQVGSGIPSKLSDVIYVSEFSRRVLESYVPATVRQHVLKNPVDIQQQPKLPVTPESPFVFVGLFDPGKDPVTAAVAANGIDVPIVFIGEGEFRDLIAEANPKAELTGWLPSPEVHQRLRKARALVFPVRWYETQGLVVQEAAALGVPAIVSRTSAATDTVVDGETGLWFNAGDSDDLAEKMRMLMNDEVAETMGAAAYARFWSDPPTLESHLSQLTEIYEHALLNQSRGAA